MVIVRFHDWREFIDELDEAGESIRTVRLTFSLRYDRQNVPYLTMVAGFFEESRIVEFLHYLGLKPHPQSPRAGEIQRLFHERKDQLQRLGYTVKAGRYHVPLTLPR